MRCDKASLSFTVAFSAMPPHLTRTFSYRASMVSRSTTEWSTLSMAAGGKTSPFTLQCLKNHFQSLKSSHREPTCCPSCSARFHLGQMWMLKMSHTSHSSSLSHLLAYNSSFFSAAATAFKPQAQYMPRSFRKLSAFDYEVIFGFYFYSNTRWTTECSSFETEQSGVTHRAVCLSSPGEGWRWGCPQPESASRPAA